MRIILIYDYTTVIRDTAMADRSAPSRATAAPHATPAQHALKARLIQLLDEVLAHDGYGSVHVDVRLLKKGQKEVILDCGKQYRFIVDHPQPGRSLTEAA